jgi:hypothetical protein
LQLKSKIETSKIYYFTFYATSIGKEALDSKLIGLIINTCNKRLAKHNSSQQGIGFVT